MICQPKGWPAVPILHFFYCSRRLFNHPSLPIEHLLKKFRPLRGLLLGYYELCSPSFQQGFDPPPRFEQCKKTATLAQRGIPYLRWDSEPTFVTTSPPPPPPSPPSQVSARSAKCWTWIVCPQTSLLSFSNEIVNFNESDNQLDLVDVGESESTHEQAQVGQENGRADLDYQDNQKCDDHC